jgi:hypothetical protein
MNLGLRTPYQYYTDEMRRIPDEGTNWQMWEKEELRRRKNVLFHFMVWSYLFIVMALLAFPFWLATGVDLALAAPLPIAAVSLTLYETYQALGKAGQ